MKGILLVNIGTPNGCDKTNVQNFIGEMLSDPLVFGKKEWMAGFLAKKIIAPLSSEKSLKKYEQIWRKSEPLISPLLFHMQELAKSLEKSKSIPVEIAMRYGKPDIIHGLNILEKKCPLLHEVLVFPLYPHYAQSTTQTLVNEVAQLFYKQARSYRIKFIEPYYNHPAYIGALAENAKKYLTDIDKVIFSCHSLPISQVTSGWEKGRDFDYVYQLKETIRLLCEKMNMEQQRTILLYSSQRGKNWLKPFLNTDIVDLPQLGWKKVAVIAPGFPIDNLETLYDIDIEARKLFMNAGGEKFIVVPSLNNTEKWVEAIWKIVQKV